MRIPGPYSDDTWDWMSRSEDVAKQDTATQTHNGISQVVWELGLMLAIPLVGASLVGLVLKAIQIY